MSQQGKNKGTSGQAQDLSTMPEENPNPILRVDHKARVLYANRAATKSLGVANNGASRLPRALADAVRQAIGSNRTLTTQITAGSRTYAFSVALVRGQSYLNLYGRDATEEIAAQRQVLDLARFPDENPSPVLRVEASGKVLYANRPAQRLPGLLANKGTRLAKALVGEAAEAARNDRIRTCDFISARRIFAMTITPVPGESYLNVYGRDVTEERQAQGEILRIKNFNEDIRKTLTNGLLTLDSRLRVTSTNPAMRRLLGMQDHSVEAETLSDLLGHTPEVPLLATPNAWLFELAQQTLRASEPQVAIDKELLGLDGERRAVNVTVAPFREGNNRHSGLILAFDDISREKRVRSTMARFMSDKVVDRLLELDESELAGTSQEVTVLFSDIRGFASLSERHGAHEIVQVLNAYFSDMVDIIFDRGGTLDKFIGDAIMAVFGAPFQSREDPDNSVKAAVEMLRRLRVFNAAQKAEGFQPIDIGVGIDTGTVIAGTIGSPRRMDYTVIGEHVNLASRTEAVNKVYGTHILISEHTRAKLLHEYRSREIDSVRVAGIKLPVRLFEILDYHTEESFPNMEQVLAVYDEGLTAYRAQRWKQAASAFAEALKLNPSDRPTQIFLNRCWNYMARPPEKSWSGVTDLMK